MRRCRHQNLAHDANGERVQPFGPPTLLGGHHQFTEAAGLKSSQYSRMDFVRGVGFGGQVFDRCGKFASLPLNFKIL